jgi:hypothetical protein
MGLPDAQLLVFNNEPSEVIYRSPPLQALLQERTSVLFCGVTEL